ncbi:MAG TPA: CDP-diacylglycerol--glycerol-3-phosphate 3-phosphatidyltransferase [Thermoanaerobaculia bacterium]|nr:CDP-diacylglycerol--glycerol-3-phosphate 3-phosphatidyltransferase [Thermoanaerobaculia bacterium]
MSQPKQDQPITLVTQSELDAARRTGRDEPGPPVQPPSEEILNLPNALTVLRIFLVPFLVVVLLTKFDGREYVGLGIFLIACLTDWLDGYLARRQRKITRVGMLLDPIADKLLMSAAFISLVELGLAPAWMIVVIIGREFAISGLRSIASQQGVTIAASSLGKWKTVSQVVAISILILGYELGRFMFIGKIALWIVVVTAIGSMIDYFLKFWKHVVKTG